MIKTTRSAPLSDVSASRRVADRSGRDRGLSREPSGAARKHKLAAAVAALAVTAGAFGMATPTLAPNPTFASVHSATTSSTHRPTAGQATPSEVGRFWVGDAVNSGALATDVQKRPSIRPIVDWLKKHGGKQFDKLKKAAKKGRSAVKDWYYQLPKPIRATIAFLWSGTLWALFDALVKYFTS